MRKTFDEELFLLKQNIEHDSLGNEIITYTEKKVYFNSKNVMMKEFYKASTHDISLEANLEIHAFEYEGEKKVRYKEKIYDIIRTYQTDEENLSIIIGEKTYD